jgi:hypothetical protein
MQGCSFDCSTDCGTATERSASRVQRSTEGLWASFNARVNTFDLRINLRRAPRLHDQDALEGGGV